MWFISLAPDAWNLSRHCQATQDAQDAGDVTQDAQDAGDVTQDAQDAGDATQDSQDAGQAKNATPDAQDTQDADSTLRASGRNGAVSYQGYSFADVPQEPTDLLPLFLNQSAILLTSPYLEVDSYIQIRLKGLRSAQPRWLWQSTHSIFPSSANPSGFSPAHTRSPPPTLPSYAHSADNAGLLVTLLLYAKKRHKRARSELPSIPVPPTDVLTKAVRNGALRSLSWDAATHPLLSASTVVVSTPLLMAPVPSAAKSSLLSVLLGTKTFLMPPMPASPKPPLRVQLLTQLNPLLPQVRSSFHSC